MQYIRLEVILHHGSNADDFHVKIADTSEEACKLFEIGFEYVTD